MSDTPATAQPPLIPGARSTGIKPLKRVSAYRTSDGATFTNRLEAECREAEIALSDLGESLWADVRDGETTLGGALIDRVDELHARCAAIMRIRARAKKQPASAS